jgi:hypothetical protein
MQKGDFIFLTQAVMDEFSISTRKSTIEQLKEFKI